MKAPPQVWAVSLLLLSILGGNARRASGSEGAPASPTSEHVPGSTGSSRDGTQRQGSVPGPAYPAMTDMKERLGRVRGMTIGPIESTLHPGRGYGTEYSHHAMAVVESLGGNWVSLTAFGRIWDLEPSGIDPTFETPHLENRKAIARAVRQAHERGLKVLLVPHLWVETGGWRGEVDFKTTEQWQAWASAYQAFVVGWAKVAEASGVDLFAVGVELRSWVTTTRAPSFFPIIDAVREVYSGTLTYAANWDDAQHTTIWGKLDVIGVNAFFPLTERADASVQELSAGGRRVAKQMADLANGWQLPIVFTEVGYTNRPDPAVKPWEWPEDLAGVQPDPIAQAKAYMGLLSGFIDEPWFLGFFVWRMYADPFDVSQEPAWGFSPLNQPAELVLRDAFGALTQPQSYGPLPHPGIRNHLIGAH